MHRVQISGVQDNSVFPSLSSEPASQKSGSSFSSAFIDAADSSDSDAVQEFMSYAKETPGQRMFTNWLAGQDITQAQFDAMSPAQQEALVKKFEQQLEQELNPNAPAPVAAAQQSQSNSLTATATATATAQATSSLLG